MFGVQFECSPGVRFQITIVRSYVLSLPILGVEVCNGDKIVEHKTFFKPNRYSDIKEVQRSEIVWFLLCLLMVAIETQRSG